MRHIEAHTFALRSSMMAGAALKSLHRVAELSPTDYRRH